MEVLGTFKENIVPASQAAPAPVPIGTKTSGIASAGRTRINPRHKMVITLHYAGYTNEEICQTLGFAPVTVSQILNDRHPELQAHHSFCQEKVADTATDVMLRFRAESMKSVETLVEVRDNSEAPFSERRLSAVAILDRAGYSPVKKQMNLNANVPVQELNAAVEKLDKANEVVERRSEWEVKTLSGDELENTRRK